METGHTLKIFDEELAHLRQSILKMVEMAGSQLDDGLAALRDGDRELAKRTIEQDRLVNELQADVDRHTLRLLAVRQPVAKDLRQILAASRMAADLERIADYASNLAKTCLRLEVFNTSTPVGKMVDMGRIAGEMLALVAKAFQNSDTQAAIHAWMRDQQLNDIYAAVMQELSNFMAKEPTCGPDCLSLVNAARALERVGDHITNLAEQVYFQITGQIFHPPSPDNEH
jgi:phosphate transport system protein